MMNLLTGAHSTLPGKNLLFNPQLYTRYMRNFTAYTVQRKSEEPRIIKETTVWDKMGIYIPQGVIQRQ